MQFTNSTTGKFWFCFGAVNCAYNEFDVRGVWKIDAVGTAN